MTDNLPFEYVKSLQKLAEATHKFTDAVNLATEQLCVILVPACQQFYEAWYQYYLAMGAPCGRNKRGFRKWLITFQDKEELDDASLP